jgi:hypothetical protein
MPRPPRPPPGRGAIVAALFALGGVGSAEAATKKPHKHYANQGGHYAGAKSGSAHKGGHYKNSRTRDHYTKHPKG